MTQSRINLLPDELKGRRRAAAKAPTDKPAFWTILVALLMLAVDAAALYYVLDLRKAAVQETARLEDEKKEKQSEIDQKMAAFIELQQLEILVDNQLKVLGKLDPPNRLLWAEKLNMLALAINENAFITQLKLSETVIEEQTPESKAARDAWTKAGAKGVAPPIVTSPVITQTLTITGVCTGENETDQYYNALKFRDDLMKFETKNARGEPVKLMDGFVLAEFAGPFQTMTESGRQVNQFVFSMKTGETRTSSAAK